MSKPVKQVLVVRKDLNMRKGKIAAQCAHASMKVFIDAARAAEQGSSIKSKIWRFIMRKLSGLLIPLDEPSEIWLSGRFTKVCVSVDSEAELLAIYEKAKAAGIKCSLIVDAGLTEFKGVPTKTVVAIGPDFNKVVDTVTAKLPLL